jgi:hypothetical protein
MSQKANRKTCSGKQSISKSQIKTVIVALFDIKCIVHIECIPLVQTVSQACFLKRITVGLIPQSLQLRAHVNLESLS